MPSPKFLSITEFIEYQKPEYQPGLLVLRELILGVSPLIEETLKFNIPFYHYKRSFLFLTLNKKRLTLGFIGGHRLSNASGLLESSHLKMVRHIFLDPAVDVEDWPLEGICETIEEAMGKAEHSWKWK